MKYSNTFNELVIFTSYWYEMLIAIPNLNWALVLWKSCPVARRWMNSRRWRFEPAITILWPMRVPTRPSNWNSAALSVTVPLRLNRGCFLGKKEVEKNVETPPAIGQPSILVLDTDPSFRLHFCCRGGLGELNFIGFFFSSVSRFATFYWVILTLGASKSVFPGSCTKLHFFQRN